MGASVRPESGGSRIERNIAALRAQGASEHDVEAYLTEHEGLKPIATHPEGSLASRVMQGIGNTVSQMVQHPIDTAVDIVKAPASSLINAVLSPGVGEARHDARLSKGGNSSGRAIDTTPYDAEHGGVTSAQRTAGGLQTMANVAFPGIARGVGAGLGGGTAARAAGLAAAGGVGGAAYTPNDPAAGFLTGAVLAPALHAAGKATGALGGTAGGAALDLVGRPATSRPVVKLGPLGVGRVDGLQERALGKIADRHAQDLAAGAAPNVPAHPSLPPLALDRLGPNVQGLVEGMANRPGAARSVIQNALDGRQAQMRPALTRQLESGTGVEASAGLGPIRDEIAQGQATMDKLYGDARAATEGQPVRSDTWEAVRKTPIGQLADAWARQQKANRMKQLPQSEIPSQTEGMVGAGDDAVAIERASDSGAMDSPQYESLPDPEMMHYAKQYLAKIARLGVQDGAGGTLAVQANGALGLWGKIREELPSVWRAADDAAATHFRTVDAMNSGRNAYRTSLNPPGNARKAVKTNLEALEQARSGPDGLAVQKGAAVAAHARLGSAPLNTKSPSRIFANSEQTIRQTALAFPSPEHANDFQSAVAAWDAAQAQKNNVLGNSRTGLRGSEGSGMGVKPSTLLGGTRAIVHSLIEKAGGAIRTANQQRVEAEVARLLMSPDLKLLSPEQRAAAIHTGTRRALQGRYVLGAMSAAGEQ